MTHPKTNHSVGRRVSSFSEARDDWTKADRGASGCMLYGLCFSFMHLVPSTFTVVG